MALPRAFSGIRGFSSFTPGSGISFTVVEDAGSALREMAEEYPEDMDRALRHLAYRVHQEIGATIREGGVPGNKWAERSRMHIYRRMDFGRKKDDAALRLKKTDKKRTAEEPLPDAMNRWRMKKGSSTMRARGAMQGRLQQGIRYKRTGEMRFDVGGLSPRVAQLLGIAQEARQTTVTETMRKAFWAAGVPIGKNKTAIIQPARDLMDAVYERMEPYFEDIITTRMESYLEGQSDSSAEEFKLPWR